MGLVLNRNALIGLAVRQNIGEYKIDPSAFIENQEEEGGIISQLWNLVKGVTGFIWKAAKVLFNVVFSFTKLWGWVVNTSQFIYNFDFGAPDDSIESQIRAQWIALSGQLGGLTGQSLGWLIGGFIPGLITLKVNEAAGLKVLKEVGDEALDELSSALWATSQSLVRTITRSLFARSFKSVRRWLRKKDGPFYGLLPQSLRTAWEQGKSWTMAGQREKKIEAIQNPFGQAFVEEANEEFGESLIEAGYVVAGGLDQYLAESRSAVVKSKVIEVTPNREYPQEKFLLAGPENELRSTLPLALANYEVLDQRDVGVVSALDTAQLFVQALPLQLYCRIEWRTDRGNAGPRPSYQISSVKRSKIGDYAFIRAIAGGQNGYLWGRWKATATMSDGHILTCYGGSAAAAEERLTSLAELSEADIQTLNVLEERQSARRQTIQGMRKPSELVFPHRIIIVNRQYFETPRPGSKPSKRGYFVPTQAKLSIRGATKPATWDEEIADLLRGPVGGG